MVTSSNAVRDFPSCRKMNVMALNSWQYPLNRKCVQILLDLWYIITQCHYLIIHLLVAEDKTIACQKEEADKEKIHLPKL